jgi:hypothetical protein
MKHIQNFDNFINESEEFLNEGNEVNLSDQFALVYYGGSIGTKRTYPIFVKGTWGDVMETGNDKEALKEVAKRRNKNLTAAEKKYYRMGYTVIELTPRKRDEIKNLSSYQQSSFNDKIEDFTQD